MLRTLMLAGGLLLSAGAEAADACADFARKLGSLQYPERIAAVACQESRLWHRPFLDAQGRLAHSKVMEAESGTLADALTPAWQRVATYWRDSGVLSAMAGIAGAGDCYALQGERWQTASCRAFLLDNPWSAAFVSYVMVRAGVPGFAPSASHTDYVRTAYRTPEQSPFLFLDPLAAPAAEGDLLCFVRSDVRVYGYAGLMRFYDEDDGGLNMHCDVVVGNGAGRDGQLTLIGGNVMHGVTLRRLPVNRAGLLWAPPLRAAVDPPCTPESEAGCNFNRQDWAVLLKLKPLPRAPAPMPSQPTGGAAPACCTICIVGAVPKIPRCPKPP